MVLQDLVWLNTPLPNHCGSVVRDWCAAVELKVIIKHGNNHADPQAVDFKGLFGEGKSESLEFTNANDPVDYEDEVRVQANGAAGMEFESESIEILSGFQYHHNLHDAVLDRHLVDECLAGVFVRKFIFASMIQYLRSQSTRHFNGHGLDITE